MTDLLGPAVSPATVAEAEAAQEELRARVELVSGLRGWPVTVAGLDVSYEAGSSRVAAAAVLIDVATLATRESAVVTGTASFPYVPGLLGFREVPILLEALAKLTDRPDVLVCDGYGIAHPRRFGLACHLGVVTGLPSFGVAKTAFTATFEAPETERGQWSPLLDGAETLGRAVRTQSDVKPVFVSVGHRVTLDEATDLTLALSPHYRLPEPTRRADALSRAALRPAGQDARRVSPPGG
ncbi:endonuclease V [Frankia sp. CNm7]|uniref:Endonuclease V n=1 Tax=Frankia nepalensis TaxID=1836974 RepID=A0A937UMQ2_9ACTN|nr:endonuclease V [Frankia nepalensis]MBL7499227.1 endonuclease V [Frankia nepalensis]MBL7512127.1 endonuclease V [Frankia nepalensis]MBL7521024.1 endonuclease V [Frankia nepalensis]MBL7627298.1 endonuclease V [Frankia nepalensis]